jgi:YD repeat-containing protein
MEFLFGWLMFSIAVGVIAAYGRGRSGGGWFLLSLLISPLLAGIIVLCLPKKDDPKASRTCPFCAETVKLQAKVCKHCHSDLPSPIVKVETTEERAARLKVQDRQAIFGSIVAVLAIIGLFATFAVTARGAEQTRVYGPDGRSTGTIVPQGEGTVRYYDSRGNSLGTSTTIGGTTRFYDARGRSTGSATRPVGPGPLGSGRSR